MILYIIIYTLKNDEGIVRNIGPFVTHDDANEYIREHDDILDTAWIEELRPFGNFS